MISLEQIREARAAIASRIHRTPLLSSNTLGRRSGARAFIKAECLQRTGSFKVRGALNKISRLTADERARGLVAVSAGNHAQAVAFAATAGGVASAVVVMPENAPRSKVEASRRYGAEVILHGNVFEAWELGQQLRRERGLTFVHPYDDPDVMAGQGTLALEIFEDAPEPDIIIVPIGGGGLISGVAAATKALRPQTRVIGVEPVGAACMSAALRAGHSVPLETVETIADGLAAPHAGELALQHVKAYVDDVVLVTDEQIENAIVFLLGRAKLLLEPAGAASVAALLAGTIHLQEGACAVAVLSGGNMDLSRLREIIPAEAEAQTPVKFGALKA